MDYSGCTQDIFTSKALDEVHKASTGIPRIINRICEKTLMYAYQQQKRLIDDYMIRFVVEHELLNHNHLDFCTYEFEEYIGLLPLISSNP